jgi:hypothetical protein
MGFFGDFTLVFVSKISLSIQKNVYGQYVKSSTASVKKFLSLYGQIKTYMKVQFNVLMVTNDIPQSIFYFVAQHD